MSYTLYIDHEVTSKVDLRARPSPISSEWGGIVCIVPLGEKIVPPSTHEKYLTICTESTYYEIQHEVSMPENIVKQLRLPPMCLSEIWRKQRACLAPQGNDSASFGHSFFQPSYFLHLPYMYTELSCTAYLWPNYRQVYATRV